MNTTKLQQSNSPTRKPTEILKRDFLELLANLQLTQIQADKLKAELPNDIYGKIITEYNTGFEYLAAYGLELIERYEGRIGLMKNLFINPATKIQKAA